MKISANRLLITFFTALLQCITAIAQQDSHLQYVNPFIGTTKSNVVTKWGNNGGTYPGAVAPSGALQLSPETRVTGAKGYDYADNSIYYFSCFGHMSGFPEGSAGQFMIMPVADHTLFEAGKYSRVFSHKNEIATPGYYKVTFNDDFTTVEATATPRSGLFKFTFGNGNLPQLFIGDAGDINTLDNKILKASNRHTVIQFSEAFEAKKQVKGGWIFTFKPAATGNKVLVLKMSTSTISFEGAQNNINKETGDLSFEEIHKRNIDSWAKQLAVADITDENRQNKTNFYTALYHSSLIPWVIDDADGRYQGADEVIHKTSGKNQYGGFSPWDTFRSLHPLLTLLYPDKQQDVILSMLDIYRQTGHLPTESMTGNHAIPIITDSYLKGLTGFDKELAYTAMKKSVLEPPFIQSDMEVYNQTGYIPFTRSESVTRTVEYAYDDWALAQYAKSTAQNPADYQSLLNRSFNYRNLFNSDELFMLPRNGNQFKLQPGMSGYKEGDKWVYAYFVPQNIKDLINLNGGNQAFATRLDSALTNKVILFDNETVFHLPYLFNQAGYPGLTQQWCRQIMLNRFSATPGGLPGNDDLGSTSSWYVFSSLGIYPVCPGRPYYAIGIPLFKKVTLHLSNNKYLTINSANATANYIQQLTVNGKAWQQLVISHSLLANGGSMTFHLGNKPGNWPVDKNPLVLSETKNSAAFKILGYSPGKKVIFPNQPFAVNFTMINTGSTGTKKVTLLVNGKPYAYKNVMLKSGQKIKDAILIRLYPLGKTVLRLEGMSPVTVSVRNPKIPDAHPFIISDLMAKALVKTNERQIITYTVKNTGGVIKPFNIPLMIDGAVIFNDNVRLAPGEKRIISHTLSAPTVGFDHISVDSAKLNYKVYQNARESMLLDLSPGGNITDRKVADQSGFQHNGQILPDTGKVEVNSNGLLFGEHTYIEVPNSPALDLIGQTISIMAWVKPTAEAHGLVDIFTKGDSHVLQVNDGKTLTFFAGGWGRGDCIVVLPVNWANQWHHIAGVCNGKTLYVYIDGALKGTTVLDEVVNLSVNNKWTLGRNEEFPSERIYHGYIDKAMVFKEALSAQDITSLYNASKR